MSTSKKGISSTELSRKLQLRQKTAWLFQRKVKEAMKSSNQNPLQGDVVVDELVLGQQEENTKGRKLIKKKLVVFGIEKKRERSFKGLWQSNQKSHFKRVRRFYERKSKDRCKYYNRRMVRICTIVK